MTTKEGPQPEHWNVGAINDMFGMLPEHSKHRFHGHGFTYRLGNAADREFTLYPQSGVVHFFSPDVDLKFYKTKPPIVTEKLGSVPAVVVEKQSEKAETSLIVEATGDYLLIGRPARRMGAGAEGATAVSDVLTPGVARGFVSAASSADVPSEADGRAIPQGEGKEQQPRVKIAGRLGRDLDVRVYPNAGAIARMNVAEKYEEDGQVKTRWHSVYNTGKRAESLRKKFEEGKLKKGDMVEIEGYEQTHPKIGRDNKPVMKDGQPVTEQRIYAVAVKVR